MHPIISDQPAKVGIAAAFTACLLAGCVQGPGDPNTTLLNQFQNISTAADTSSKPLPANVNCLTAIHDVLKDQASPWTQSLGIVVENPAADLEYDINIPVVDQADSLQFDCLIELDYAQIASLGERKVLADRELHSSYQIGTRKVINPDYRARLDRQKKTVSERESSFIETGDDELDFLGQSVAGIIDAFSRNEEAENLDQESTDVPRFLETPQMRPYQYRLRDIEANRSARVPVILTDQRNGQSLKTDIFLSERRYFALSDDRHPNDRSIQHDPNSLLINSVGLHRWERSAPPLSISTLLDHLRLVGSQNPLTARLEQEVDERRIFGQAEISGPANTIEIGAVKAASDSEAVLARLGSLGDIEPTMAPSAHPPANVRKPYVEPDRIYLGAEKEAAGFFVAPDYILAPIHIIQQHTALVPIHFPDRSLVYGLVEKQDEEAGVALIYTPRDRTPRRLALSNIEPPASLREFSGAPLIWDNLIVGSWIRNRNGTWQFLSGPDIQRISGNLIAQNNY